MIYSTLPETILLAGRLLPDDIKSEQEQPPAVGADYFQALFAGVGSMFLVFGSDGYRNKNKHNF
ncbi:hypothetical protein [Maribellus sediminis]|uniref:hypothetical protein n=1 Tax=Maribellus sediminis TaxID=2696285 RepID=UPI001F0EAD3C|nr:hypothetical protein [Maribellus sediminis]